MTMLRVIVNIAVALGVISTNYVPFTTAFAAVSTLMMISAGIQLSMVDNKEWRNFVRRMSSIHNFRGSAFAYDSDEESIKATLVELKRVMPSNKENDLASVPAARMSPNNSNTSINSDLDETISTSDEELPVRRTVLHNIQS